MQLQWNPSVTTTAACPYYRGVHISEASGIFPVGVAMHPMLLSAMKVCSRALPCCMLARKADQRPDLCEPMLLPGMAVNGNPIRQI